MLTGGPWCVVSINFSIFSAVSCKRVLSKVSSTIGWSVFGPPERKGGAVDDLNLFLSRVLKRVGDKRINFT